MAIQTRMIGSAPSDVALGLSGDRVIENIGTRPLWFVVGASSGEPAPTNLDAGHLLEPGRRELVTLVAGRPLWVWAPPFGSMLGVGPGWLARPGSGGAPPAVSTIDTTLTAAQIAGLGTTRVQLIAADADNWIVPSRLLVLKTGGPANPIGSYAGPSISVAAAPAAGGLLSAPFDWVYDDTVYGTVGDDFGWLAPGAAIIRVFGLWRDTGLGLSSGSGGSKQVNAWRNSPLVVCGRSTAGMSATPEQEWARLMAPSVLGDLRIRILLEYQKVTA